MRRGTPKSSEKRGKEPNTVTTPGKATSKQPKITDLFQRQVVKQEATKLSSPVRIIFEGEVKKEEDEEPKLGKNRLSLSKSISPGEEKRLNSVLRKSRLIFDVEDEGDEDKKRSLSSTSSFLIRDDLRENPNQSWDALGTLGINNSHFTTPSKKNKNTSNAIVNLDSPSTSKAAENGTPRSIKREEWRTSRAGKRTPSGSQRGKRGTPSSSKSGEKGSPFTHKKFSTPSSIEKLRQTTLSFESSPDTKTPSKIVNASSSSSSKSRKRLTEGEFSPNHKRTKICLEPLDLLEDSDDDITIIEAETSVKCEKLETFEEKSFPSSSNVVKLDVNCNVQTCVSDQSQLKAQRRHRFLNKIPQCFKELKNSFSPLSPHNRIKKSEPNVFLRLAELKTKAITVNGSEIVLEEQTTGPSDENSPQEESQESQRLAYYWSNFLEIVHSVLNIPEDKNLFNEDDLATIKQYYIMSENAQMLYSRLFVRNHDWIPLSKIKYPEIAEDLDPYIQELITANYLQGDNSLNDLETILNLLQVKQIKDLCKDFNVKCENSKKKCIESILNNCSRHRPLFSSFGDCQQKRLENISKKAKEVLSRCFRVSDKARNIFRRVMMLYSLSDTHWDSTTNDNQPVQLTNLMHVNMGKLKFPSCKIEREKSIFRSRDDLLNYEKAFTLESEIWSLIESKSLNEAMQLCNVAHSLFREFVSDTHNINHVSSLPDFLRKYTSGSLLVRCLNYRVDLFEKSKFYDKANEQLSELLNQSWFCQNYRGHWYERFALNAHQHLKNPIEALKAIENGQNDPRVTDNYRLSLYNRAARIRSFKKLDPKLLEGITVFEVGKAPEIEIRGQKIEKTSNGFKSFFIDERDWSVCSVEQFALKNYAAQGYSKGVHAEGSVIISIFGLLFWDVIYAEGIPDAFRNPHQAFPLDLFSEQFVLNRTERVQSRFEFLECSSIEIVLQLVEENYMDNLGTTSVVNWDLLNLEDFLSLIRCMGMACVSKICERFIKNLRHYRSGLPDLTVWNPETKIWKMVEVKGPGDRLSDKQIIWLDFLGQIGCPVEVCYVKAIGGRNIPKSGDASARNC